VTLCAGATGGVDEVDVEGGVDEADEAEGDAVAEVDAAGWCLVRLAVCGFAAGGSFNDTS
jgi:hypothetical protein